MGQVMSTNELVIRAQLGSEVVATAIGLLTEAQRLKDALDFNMTADDSVDTNRDVTTVQQAVCDIIEQASDAVTTLRVYMEGGGAVPRVVG
jgi:hypothetical protein